MDGMGTVKCFINGGVDYSNYQPVGWSETSSGLKARSLRVKVPATPPRPLRPAR